MDDLVIQSVWDDLLDYVEAGKVIPIIGAELLNVEHEGSPLPLYGYVARKLAERLMLPPDMLPANPTLNDVVCQYTTTPGRQREDVYPKISRIMKETRFEPPELLRKLARITPFNLFVTLTFDLLLTAAINEVRFGGKENTVELAYSPSPGRADDLRTPRSLFAQPVVYHLFGKVSAAPEYVITDECILEFLHDLQAGERRPKLLSDELRANHLLFLGCNFSDWFARFFIRTAKSKQLSMQRPEIEVLVDSTVSGDGQLVMFLEHFSHRTRIMPGSAADFVTELERRYLERNAAMPDAGTSTRFPAMVEAAQDGMSPGAVFISYASEDKDAALALHASLQAFGVEAWFDKKRLKSGDRWEQRLKSGVRDCACFVPMMSAASTTRSEGYFIAEWNWAQERTKRIAEGTRFIMPVSIDGTPETADGVPELFRTFHWEQLPGGMATPDFAGVLKQLVRNHRLRLRGT